MNELLFSTVPAPRDQNFERQPRTTQQQFKAHYDALDQQAYAAFCRGDNVGGNRATSQKLAYVKAYNSGDEFPFSAQAIQP